MIKYTAGLLFHKDNVLLVEKNHPDWQNRLFNAISGKVDANETPMDSMVREFKEEVGFDGLKWDLFCIETGADYMVYFYKCFVEKVPDAIPPTNDCGERLQWFYTRHGTAARVVGNLHWLIPMARDWRSFVAKIETQDRIRENASW